jgi:hypothetical protein
LLVTLLRQLPRIATRQVLEDNVWQACPIAQLSVTILHVTGQHMNDFVSNVKYKTKLKEIRIVIN